MRRSGVALLALGLGVSVGAAERSAHIGPSRSGTFTVVNKSGRQIAGLRLTTAGDELWSADRLNGGSLAVGAFIELRVACEEVDVRLVDAVGRVCVYEAVHPCGNDATWTITGQMLTGCGRFGS